MTWEDTLAARRGDGTRVFLREFAVPLRGPSGDIDGMVVLVSEAGRRDAQREPDRLRLLERISERLAGSLEFDTTLRQVAQILVPRFADHCFIDLFSGEKLIRRAAAHAGGWEPPPGTWAQVGEAISYPPGHFAEQAMSRLETIVVPDLQADFYPAPSEESMSAADQAGLTSVLASPLYARGELLGVISMALSRITDRPDPHYDLSDGDLIGAIAAGWRWRSTTRCCSRPSGGRRSPSSSRCCRSRCPCSTASRSRSATSPPSRWPRSGRASRPRSAGTGTTSSRWRRAGWAW